MEVKAVLILLAEFFCVFFHSVRTSVHSESYNLQGFLGSDTRIRSKRNATSQDVSTDIKTMNVTPEWRVDLLSGKYYGSEQYLQRKLYMDNPDKRPALCFNNVTHNSSVFQQHYFYFYCPMENQSDALKYCCGDKLDQKCCSKEEYHKSSTHDKETPKDLDDLVTLLGIAAAFTVSITLCLFLYCCCCQRRPEIQNGFKLMWVRRSFGKELNRLEQPAYQDHMTVVNSITGIRESRHGSRQGSRAPSRQGSLRSNRSPHGSFKARSRAHSVTASPSVSRRSSHEHGHGNQHSNTHSAAKTAANTHLGSDLPTSNVLITVTTPSDEHGPAAPLLPASKQEVTDEV